jgi:hypothetical protein
LWERDESEDELNEDGSQRVPTLRDKMLDESLFSRPKAEVEEIRAKIRSKFEKEATDDGDTSLVIGKKSLETDEEEEPEFQPIGNPALIQANRILTRFHRSPFQTDAFNDPLSPFYRRPVFDNSLGTAEESEYRRAETERTFARNYVPKTSYTAQFTHLLPAGRRLF